MARAKVEGIVYKLIDGMSQSSKWYPVKENMVFSPVATKKHAVT